jgi:Tat protein translocase TatB subunit
LGSLGGPELLLIFIVALIVFGPRKLPEIGKSVGKMMAEFRKASNDFKQTIESEVEAEKLRDAVRVDPYVPGAASAREAEPPSKAPTDALARSAGPTGELTAETTPEGSVGTTGDSTGASEDLAATTDLTAGAAGPTNAGLADNLGVVPDGDTRSGDRSGTTAADGTPSTDGSGATSGADSPPASGTSASSGELSLGAEPGTVPRSDRSPS